MISKFKYRIILVLMLAVIVTYAFFSEKMLINEGLGYDGVFYGKFTMYFNEYIRDHTVNKYHFQRAFIPFIIYHLFSVLHIELSIPNVIFAYRITNVIFIFVGIYFFFRISNFIKLSKSIEVIGFASLFFCFPVLKLCLFYPILMDIPAFGMAIILVDLYLRRNIYLFFFVILVSSFIYPTFILLSVLYFFNPEKKDEINVMKQSGLVSFLNNVLYVLVCYALPVFLIYNYITLFWLSSFKFLTEQFKTNTTGTLNIWFGFLLALMYVVSLNYFSRKIFVLQRIFKSINYSGVILGIIVFVLAQLLINYFASKTLVAFTMKEYFYAVIHQAVEKPMNFLAAHIFYFGPALLLSLFVIKDIKREVVNFGFGMILFFNMAIFFSVGSESRQLINYYPFLILLLLYALNKYWEISIKFSCIFAVICLALSHFWYSINIGIDERTGYGSPLEFPLQHYFMFQGPWVSDMMYKIHLAVVCFLLVLFWFLIKKSGLVKRKTEALYS